MPCDDLPDDLNVLWKQAGTDRPVFSPDQLRNYAGRLQARRRGAHAILGACLAIFVAYFALLFFLFHSALTRIGSILGVFGFGYWLVQILAERARTQPDLGETGGLRFYRAELERTRGWHRQLLWRWLLLPLPFILFELDLARMYAKHSPFIAPFVCFGCGLMLAWFTVALPLVHLRAARKLKSRIDALDAAIKSNGEVSN